MTTPTTPTGIKLHEWLSWAGPRMAGIPDSELVARIEAEAYERGCVAGMAMEKYAPTPPDAPVECGECGRIIQRHNTYIANGLVMSANRESRRLEAHRVAMHAAPTPPDALDVERLARAVHRTKHPTFTFDGHEPRRVCGCLSYARWLLSIAREYAALAEPSDAPDVRGGYDAKREAVIHAARDVDGLWFPQDDNDTGTDLTFWGPEAGEALRDLRDAVQDLYDAEDDQPISRVTTPDGQVYRAHVPCCWCGEHHEEER